MERLAVDAELVTPTGRVQLVRLNHPGPADSIFSNDDVYWVDLCLTPRRPHAEASYVDRWATHRFHFMGPIIALPPKKPIQIRNSGGSHASLLCQVRAGAVERWFSNEYEWTDRRLEACLDIASVPIRNLLQRLALELRRPGLASNELAEALCFQLSIELPRHLTAMRQRIETGGLAAWRLQKIDRRLAMASDAPTLVELAALCNMSVRQMTRAFRISRGCSIGEYGKQMRIETAKRQLAAGETIKAIATSLGFASQANFSVAFRAAIGVTPSLFRESMFKKIDLDLKDREA